MAADELVKSGIKNDIVNLEGGYSSWNYDAGTKTY